MGFLRGLVTQNLSLKLASLFLAVLLWTVHRAETRLRQSLTGVPVRVELADPAWALSEAPLPAEIEVVFNGTTRELLQLAVDRPVLNIPVDQVHQGDTIIFLRREWLRFPGQGVAVEGYQPSSVRLTFEPIQSRTVPLKATSAGALPAGLALSAPVSPDPRVIRVSGPESRVTALDSVRLEPVDLTIVERSGAYPVQVDTTGMGILNLSLSEADVIVQVEDQVRREVMGVPVVPSGGGGGRVVDVRPSVVSVLLFGARSSVDGVEEAGLRAVFPGNVILDLAEGDSIRVPVRVTGHSGLVVAVPGVDSVTVRWASGDVFGGTP